MTPSRRPPTRAAAWLLVLALLQAQALGHWHRVAHAPQALSLHDASPAAPVADAFGHEADDDSQCRLYDALGLASGIATSPAAMPAAPQATPAPGGHPAAAPARVAAWPYQARAPPA